MPGLRRIRGGRCGCTTPTQGRHVGIFVALRKQTPMQAIDAQDFCLHRTPARPQLDADGVMVLRDARALGGIAMPTVKAAPWITANPANNQAARSCPPEARSPHA